MHLVRPESFQFEIRSTTWEGRTKKQLRGLFKYKRCHYDFTLTDPLISRKYFPLFHQAAEGYSEPNDPSQILLCISLTPPFKDGLHYKVSPPSSTSRMNVAPHLSVFTIGHSNLELAKFVALLKQHSIQAVADVRSSPYSQYNPQFNREPLQRALQEQGISYVFLGEELGARRSERECYLNGRADYEMISHTPAFKRGIERVVQGAAKMRVALLCAEKDPVECHRCILVSPHLRQRGVAVFHILTDGTVESHEQTEKRLLRLFELPERELFRSSEEIVARLTNCRAKRLPTRKTNSSCAKTRHVMEIKLFTIGFTRKTAREFFTSGKTPGSGASWTFA